MKIGIDFDNTLISYESVFSSIFSDFGLDHYPGSKTLLKKALIERDGDDTEWQKVQARVYGPEILKANPAPGLLDFLKSYHKVHELFIVSHKTERSNIDSGVNLRDWARKWLKDNGVYNFISVDRIFFLNELDQKVLKIKELGLELFIDDLEKVARNQFFPSECRFILFSDIEGPDIISDFSQLEGLI